MRELLFFSFMQLIFPYAATQFSSSTFLKLFFLLPPGALNVLWCATMTKEFLLKSSWIKNSYFRELSRKTWKGRNDKDFEWMRRKKRQRHKLSKRSQNKHRICFFWKLEKKSEQFFMKFLAHRTEENEDVRIIILSSFPCDAPHVVSVTKEKYFHLIYATSGVRGSFSLEIIAHVIVRGRDVSLKASVNQILSLSR